MSDAPTEMPPTLVAAIRELVSASGLSGVAARELRADLEAHARDGLEAGRDPAELARRLGDRDESVALYWLAFEAMIGLALGRATSPAGAGVGHSAKHDSMR